MAAWLWRSVVAAAAMLTAAAWLVWLRPSPWWTLPLCAAAGPAAAATALTALSFAVARAVDPAPAGGPHVRALLTELLAFPLAVLAMCRGSGRRADADPEAAGPVMLLHGILCNARVWDSAWRRLHEAGYGPVEALDVEPLLADIDVQARGVLPRVLALQRRCGGRTVLLVGHSMGGLIARAVLRELGPSVVRGIVTLATPHHGSALVAGLGWPCTRQMSRLAQWLQALNAGQEGRFAVPVASIYTRDDNLVAPAASSRLLGAENRELDGIGHLGLLRARAALDCLVATLARVAEASSP